MGIMKKLLWLIFLIFLVWLNFYPEPVRKYRPFTEVEKQWLTERMKLHGISRCECDGNVCWFIRDGEKCRL
jgi:hypothetical protein